jgi:hypothetical protein
MLGNQEAPSMERLTGEDRLMLSPDERWPQEIGALAVLDGARLLDPGRPVPERGGAAVEGLLHLVRSSGSCRTCHGAPASSRQFPIARLPEDSPCLFLGWVQSS